jgi:hypothetical protein
MLRYGGLEGKACSECFNFAQETLSGNEIVILFPANPELLISNFN